ncbi:glycoside hydrolase family 2 TIM barrel-domain containing protein [Inconstantimicrobium mannanitabidum]|uniref:Beta-galactosidase n=1 Tax=Inconstantimicrobium mannanitabidum TaxID=1604901 RepID=A0ACB5R990_9CLOT|nr:glycoside hydrolase family 2 TIM barrel-domain containing protein [Clostridium sp. TW13]GKX65759.1 beta-galactosidase [Clostridium sp. TW13]
MNTRVRSRVKFNKDWYFTRNEIGPIPKNHQKSALIGGYTNNAIDEEGSLFLNGSAIEPLLKVMHRPRAASEHEYKDWFAMESIEKGKEGWEKVKLPHDAVLNQEYVMDFKNGMYGFLPQTVGYYRKTFTLPKEDEGKKIFIEFDGVGRISDYWVNGCYIGENFSGYNSFSFDITDLLKYGEEGENVILVKIDTTCGNEGWWYEGGGIYRNVWLTKTDKLHVDKWGTYVQTPRIEQDKAVIRVETVIFNEDFDAAEYTLKTSIINPYGDFVGENVVNIMNEGMHKNKVIQEITVCNPELWEIDSPKLYKAITEVIVHDEIKDDYETVFGIRSIEYTTKGLFLNGKHTPIKGMSVHQDFAGVGVAVPDRIHEFKIKKLKEAGVNAYRCAHNLPASELLDACDRLGMLVMNEGRLLEASEIRIKELEAQVLRDRNHPSVFMWSISNEEFIGGSSLSIRMHKRMRNIVKSLDPTRLVTSADIFGSSSGKHMDALDVIGVNYIESDLAQSYVLQNLEAYPDKLFISTENVMKATTRGCYEDSVEKCSISCLNSEITHMSVTPVETAGGAGGTCPPEKAWEFYLNNPRMGGLFVWTGFDYRGEPFPFFWPSVMAQSGTFDLCGLPKDNFYLYQAMWIENKPLVHLFPHWTWADKIGENISVRAITNCEEVELILNGKSIGRKTKEKGEYYVDFDVEYMPGELIVKAYSSGIEVAKDAQKTSGQPAGILLLPDQTIINADGEDVTIVTAAIVDKDGIIVPNAQNKVKFNVISNGSLIGTGNGNPMDHDSDKTNYRNAFNGYCIAIVQSTEESGPIIIEASSDELATAKIEIIASK